MKLTLHLKSYAAYLLIILISVLDYFVELGFAIGIIHMIAIYMAAWSRKRWTTIIITMLAIISIITIYVIHKSLGHHDDEALINRIISIIIVLSSAIFLEIQNHSIKRRIMEYNQLEIDTKKMVDQIRDYVILLLDKEGNIRNWNVGAEGITGYQESEIIGKNYSCLFTNSDQLANKPTELLEKARKESKTAYQGWFKRKNTIPFFANISINAIYNLEGKFNGYSMIARDRSEEKKQQEIRAAINKMARVGSWEVDLIQQKVYWSPMTREIHEVDENYTPDLQSGINFYLEGYDRETITTLVEEAIETGKSFEAELRIKTTKGDIKWVKATGTTQVIDGKCIRLYGSFQDINEKKISELRLKESEEQFRKTFEYSANGKAIIGPDGKWLAVNKAICDIVGYSKEELFKLTFQDITHPDDLDNDLSLLKDLIDDKIDSYQMEKRYFHKDGHIVWILLAVSKIVDNQGNVKHFISQITDITKRKIAEQELEKMAKDLLNRNQELEQFAHITSHDLQEPLRTINSFTELFEKHFSDKVDDKGKKYIDFVSSASKRLQGLVKGLMEYSRLGKNGATPTEVDLNKVIKSIKDDLSLLIEETNTSLKYKKLPTINGYEIELQLLFRNLISNAIKFKHQEVEPEIEISFKERENEWEFAIKDNGIGILDKDYEKIFHIFRRLHSQTMYQGSGIGLAHCKKVVELHNGKIWVESEGNTGSTFYFTLQK